MMSDQDELLKQMDADFIARMKSMADEEATTFKSLSDQVYEQMKVFREKFDEFLQNPIVITKDKVDGSGAANPQVRGEAAQNGGANG